MKWINGIKYAIQSNTMAKLNKGKVLLAVIFFVLVLHLAAHSNVHPAFCPYLNDQILSDHLTIGYDASITLQHNVDVLCYNYTFKSSFTSSPGVAISVSHLQSQFSPDLFFSIKSLGSTVTSPFHFIPIVIRIQWKYTSWIKISFSILAENRPYIEANYCQIDTSALSGCESGKDIRLLLQFKQPLDGKIESVTFISGMQMSSQQIVNNWSPYQIQVNTQITNSTGIILRVTVTTISQVNALTISYIAYNQSFTNGRRGQYLYQTYTETQSLYHNVQTFDCKTFHADFYGLSGFIIKNSLQTNFVFQSQYRSNFVDLYLLHILVFLMNQILLIMQSLRNKQINEYL